MCCRVDIIWVNDMKRGGLWEVGCFELVWAWVMGFQWFSVVFEFDWFDFCLWVCGLVRGFDDV